LQRLWQTAQAKAGRLLRVLFVWLGTMSADASRRLLLLSHSPGHSTLQSRELLG
jgi:hypothetical protein